MITQLRIQAMAQLAHTLINVTSGNYPSESGGWDNYLQECSEIGFEFLGNGFFSAAFLDTESGKVLKVGYKKEDSGAAYAAFCRVHQGKAGIPTIHDIQRHESCYTVVMEQCTEFDRDNPSTTQDMWDAFRAASDMIDQECTEARGYDNSALTEISKTAALIVSFFKGVASFDLHYGNVMIENGRFVITDPVSYTAGREKTAWDAIDNLDVIAKVRREVIMNRARKRHAYQLEKPQRRKVRAKEKRAHIREHNEALANQKARIKAHGFLRSMSRWSKVAPHKKCNIVNEMNKMIDDQIKAVMLGVDLPIDINFDAKLQKTPQRDPQWSIFKKNEQRAKLDAANAWVRRVVVPKNHIGLLTDINDGLAEFLA